MSSGLTSLCLHPGQFTQSGLCHGRRALVGLHPVAHEVWQRQQEDPRLPQTRRGVAGRCCTHPLAEPMGESGPAECLESSV